MKTHSIIFMPAITLFGALLAVPTAWAQEEGVSLGELARRERERKRNAAQPARVLTLEDKLLDCGGNWDCLSGAVDRKEEAKLQFAENVDLGNSAGARTTSEIHIELRDFTGETVVLKAWPENTRLQFSARTREFAQSQGVPQEAVDLQERLAERNLQKQDGKVVTCTFKHARMKEFIAQVRANPENDNSWALAERCDGLDLTFTSPQPRPQPQPEPQSSGAATTR